MSEMKEMLVEVVEKMLKDKVDKEAVDVLENGDWGEALWALLRDNGMIDIAVPEAEGGAGGDLADLVAVYDLIGKYAAPIPFVEHTLANVLLHEVGEKAQQALTTFAIVEADTTTLPFVPWARYAEQVVVVTRQKLSVFPLSNAHIEPSTNLASEPRDTVTVASQPIVEVPISDVQYETLLAIVTAATIVKSAGAIDKAVELTVKFSKEREQFGRPIHRFQMVQQHLAQIAGEQAIVRAAAANIIENFDASHIGYACLRLEDAIRIVATSAHQVHAAIGVTDEHRLNHYTRRLWAWRDEAVKASYWTAVLVEQVLASDVDIWTTLTTAPQTENV